MVDFFSIDVQFSFFLSMVDFYSYHIKVSVIT